jgi:hypothetical protein
MDAVMSRKLTFFFYLAVLLFGIIFYVLWSSTYDTWTDIGVYSVTVICVGFGLLGALLYMPKKAEAQE